MLDLQLNLVRAGYGFNKTAIFELKKMKQLKILINYAGGLKKRI
jgi:hypothetical protein